jgi:hypothetical protein
VADGLSRAGGRAPRVARRQLGVEGPGHLADVERRLRLDHHAGVERQRLAGAAASPQQVGEQVGRPDLRVDVDAFGAEPAGVRSDRAILERRLDRGVGAQRGQGVALSWREPRRRLEARGQGVPLVGVAAAVRDADEVNSTVRR